MLALAAPLGPPATGSGSTDHLDGEKVSLPGPVILREGTLDVGRVPPCDVVLAIPTVSSRHAILTVEGDKVRAASGLCGPASALKPGR